MPAPPTADRRPFLSESWTENIPTKHNTAVPIFRRTSVHVPLALVLTYHVLYRCKYQVHPYSYMYLVSTGHVSTPGIPYLVWIRRLLLVYLAH